MAEFTPGGVKILNSTIRADNNRAVFRGYLPKEYKYNMFSGDPVYLGADGFVHSLGEAYITFLLGAPTRAKATAYSKIPLLGIAQKFWINVKGQINLLTLSSQDMYLSYANMTDDYIGVDVCIDPTALSQFKVSLEGLTDQEKTTLFSNIGKFKFSPAFVLTNDAPVANDGTNIVGSTTNGGGSSCYFTTKKFGDENAYLTADSAGNALLGNASYSEMQFSYLSFGTNSELDDVYYQPSVNGDEFLVQVSINNSKVLKSNNN